MSAGLILEAKNKERNWKIEEAAQRSNLPIDYYVSILSGAVKPTYEDAEKLSVVYDIPAALFLKEDYSATHLNLASGAYSNSNHGYIKEVIYNSDKGSTQLLKDLISALKPDLEWPKTNQPGQTSES